VKIIDQEMVIRYHVEYDEEETLILKSLGLLLLYTEPRARLWFTKAEKDQADALIAKVREEISRTKEDAS